MVRATTTDALLLRLVPVGEADVVVTLLTRALGKVPALARGVRKGSKRWAGAFEPMHTLRVGLDERPGAELCMLREASIAHPRFRLIGDLERMLAAGQALRWVRAGAPIRTPEPDVWDEVETLLDHLDDASDALPPPTHLAASGLRLLRHFGYGLELAACVRCGRRCEPERTAFVDAALGGLLCQGCGGGHSRQQTLLEPGERGRLVAASSGRDGVLLPSDTELARRLVDEALAAHAGVEG